jgi:hypothetical protein
MLRFELARNTLSSRCSGENTERPLTSCACRRSARTGRNLSIAFTVALLHDAQGNVTAIASIMRDETDRFEGPRHEEAPR